ncbi:alpha/beta hydrolase [Prescottella defluvii]|uniref:alpha/beta hydrolase n=1 Tax=Prescottella defluvii TaxID=1323361 RepID=UPI00068E6F3D|nr:alpha/beta hydrolase [Prescottella defluvii]
MVGLSQLRAWQPDLLAAAGTAVAAANRAFGDAMRAAGSHVDTAMSSWQGTAAEAAGSRSATEQDTAGRITTAVTAQADALTNAAASIGPARLTALAIADEAIASGFAVADDGRVGAPPFVSGNPVADLLIQAQLGEQAAVLEARLMPALATVGELDARAGAALDAATSQLGDTGAARAGNLGTDGLPEPIPGATAADNKKYWDSLTEDQRRRIIEEHPDWVGNRDGIPSSVRHEANVSRFDDERSRLEAERDRLQANLDDNFFGGTFTNDDAALWYTEQKLRDLDEIEGIGADNPDGRLMLLDLQSGERGMAAFAVGDPDTADHISVTTPGLNTNIDDSFNSMVTDADALKSETEKQLQRAGRRDETVASIAWLGYEPPQTTGPGLVDGGRGVADVMQSDRATAGADDLARFYDGLDVASQHPDPHITALGHSYGSLTTGLALQDPGPGQPVDDAVFYGSPGINADDESDLGLAEGHAYVMEADDDWFVAEVGKTHRFGPDPSTSNFEQLSTDAGTSPDGVTREGVYSHGGYPQLGNNQELRMSGYNMAAVVAGLPDQMVRR